VPEAKSPDGRVWKVESHREGGALRESMSKPGFIANAVVTVILLVAIVFLARRSVFFAVLGVAVLLIWVLERGTAYFRPIIEARTEGPPPEHVGWKATGRFGHRELEERAVRAIERGEAETEPPGLRMVEL
jgi:hypothetical protein